MGQLAELAILPALLKALPVVVDIPKNFTPHRSLRLTP
jgi:hypothetical protein